MTIYIVQMLMSLFSQSICAGQRFSRKIKKISLLITILFLSIFSAIRYGIGGDYTHYVNLYNAALVHGSQDFYTEPGFNLLLVFLTRCGMPSQSIFIISSVLLGIALWYFITSCVENRYWGLCIFLFISFGFYFSSLNILRQYMAFSIGLFALVFLKKKKFMPFIGLVIIAMFFHTAAIFLFAVPLFSRVTKLKHGFWVLSFMYIISLTFILFDIRPFVAWLSNFVNRWSGYSDSTYFTEKNAGAILKLFIPNLLAIWYLITFSNKESVLSNDNKWSDIGIVGILYVFLQNIFFGIMVLTRISEMFGMCFILWTIGVITSNKEKYTNVLFELLLYVYGFVLTFVTIFQMNGYGVMPYQSIF